MGRVKFYQGICIIFFSTLFISGSSYLGYFQYRHMQKKRLIDPKNHVQYIMQAPDQVLKTAYLEELLEISNDRPINLYSLDLDLAKQKLLKSPLIATAELKKYFPHTLLIKYTTRKPIAWLSDYENILIDNEGYIFPAYPFLFPKDLPQIYLGLSAFGQRLDKRDIPSWESPLKDSYASLALNLIELLNQEKIAKSFTLKKIDVSSAFSDSYGKREIVLMIEDQIVTKAIDGEKVFLFPKILRLGTKNYAEQIGNFLILQKKMKKDYQKQLTSQTVVSNTIFSPRVIDLRLSSLAFIDDPNEN